MMYKYLCIESCLVGRCIVVGLMDTVQSFNKILAIFFLCARTLGPVCDTCQLFVACLLQKSAIHSPFCRPPCSQQTKHVFITPFSLPSAPEQCRSKPWMKFASTSMLLHTALSHKVALVIAFEHKTRTFFY